MAFTLDESDRQATLLSLALTALLRPGWDDMLGRIAERLDGREMDDTFKRLNDDVVKPTPVFGERGGQ